MKRNVIFELVDIREVLMERGYYKDIDDSVVLYDDYVKEIFMKLTDFVRRGSFVSSLTQKFVCENFMVAQADLANLWSVRHPDGDERASSTFRLSSQKVNEVLAILVPDDVVDAFVNNNVERVKEIGRLIDTYVYNDIHIENDFGIVLSDKLNSLPSTYKHFEVEDCTKELHCLYQMSEAVVEKAFAECDKEKLAYIYDLVRRPAFNNGKVNQKRLDFIRGYLDMGERESAVDTKSTSAGNDMKANVSRVDNKTVLTDGVVGAMQDYIGTETSNEETMINPDIIVLLASVSAERFRKSLSIFPKEEVDYVLELFKAGDEGILDMYRKYISTGEKNNIGDFYFLSGVLQKMNEVAEGVDPSGKSSPYVAQVLADYTFAVFNERMETLNPDDVAQAILDLSDNDSEIARLINKFSTSDIIAYEQERLGVKKESLG